MSTDAYTARLGEIDDRVSAQQLAPDGGPPLMRDAASALLAAVDADPRDLELVRERVLDIAANALRVIRSMVRNGQTSGLPNPTIDRLPGLIHDWAPNTANAPIGDDDPVRRFADEITGAAGRYADADPRTVSGSPPQLLRELFRVVGLAGNGLAVWSALSGSGSV